MEHFLNLWNVLFAQQMKAISRSWCPLMLIMRHQQEAPVHYPPLPYGLCYFCSGTNSVVKLLSLSLSRSLQLFKRHLSFMKSYPSVEWWPLTRRLHTNQQNLFRFRLPNRATLVGALAAGDVYAECITNGEPGAPLDRCCEQCSIHWRHSSVAPPGWGDGTGFTRATQTLKYPS